MYACNRNHHLTLNIIALVQRNRHLVNTSISLLRFKFQPTLDQTYIVHWQRYRQ